MPKFGDLRHMLLEVWSKSIILSKDMPVVVLLIKLAVSEDLVRFAFYLLHHVKIEDVFVQ